MRIGIVGGGIMGITLGYFLAKKGVAVDIFEASPTLGGLAGPLTLPDGTAVDRYYHAILSSDDHLWNVCAELNLTGELRFNQTRTAFYHGGRIYSMNNLIDFLRFQPLTLLERFRLGLTVLRAQLVRDWHDLEGISVEKWLRRWSGNGTYEKLWNRLLRAKFDGGFENTPATYMWARLVRMKSTRGGADQKESAGHLVGGYATLMEAMASRITQAGGTIHLRTPVQEIMVDGDRVTGLRLADRLWNAGPVVVTMQTPVFRRLIPAAGSSYHEFLAKSKYLGLVCPLVVLDRPLSGYWTVNITDDSIPFTGIIETTSYIDPALVGGHHLVYIPKYTAPDSPWLQKSDDEIKDVWLSTLSRMFPAFDRSWVRFFLVHRERFVDPLHPMNSIDQIPPVRTPIAGLYFATTAQIYPALTNGESVTRHAREAADIMMAGEAATAELQVGEPALDDAPAYALKAR